MNVIVGNTQRDVLSSLDIDIIKSIYGEYEASEIVNMFKSFFYNKMILDVTAIKNFKDVNNFQTIAMGLDVEKIVFFLPEGSDICTSNFLSKLVSMGIYNFTTNVEGIKYLLNNPNTYKNVAHIQQFNGLSNEISARVASGTKVIGIRNVTEHAGATTLIYMLKRELNAELGDTVIAIEVDKNDFRYFNDKNMMSVPREQLRDTVSKYSGASAILVDLNNYEDDSCCGDVLYLIEPSTIKLNKLMRTNRHIFSKLNGKRIVLNKSLLTNKDIMDFEYEAKAKIFYNMPPLDERKRNNILSDFLTKVGLLEEKDKKKESSGKIFGLFRR